MLLTDFVLTIHDFDDFDVNTIVDSAADPIELSASNTGGGEEEN